MKKILLFTVLFLCVGLGYSQNVTEQEFIKQLTEIYNKRKDTFSKQSESTMGKERLNGDFDYIIHPYINSKSDKKLYKNIDSTNLIKYLEPKSLGYWGAFVIEDNNLKGIIRIMKKNTYEFSPFISQKNNNLYLLLNDIKPDIIFHILGLPGEYFIKDGAVYVIELNEKLENCEVYPINEFVSKNREWIFDMFNGRSEILD